MRANGIEIEYESLGPADGRPLLLVRGLGTQLIHWPPALCRALVERGFRVVVFDNRDAGLSSDFDREGAPDLGAVTAAVARGAQPDVPYTLEDMADDAIALLDGLGIASAHLCGISLGGAVVQLAALRHPTRARSLISVMSTTGDPALPPPTPEASAALLSALPTERAAYIEHALAGQRIFAGPNFDADAYRALAGRAFDRSFRPAGVSRQLAAILANGDRTPALAKLRVPSLVIHGRQDPLIPPEHGEATARAIPGAELLLLDGMGHDLPRAVWPEFVDAVSRFAEKVERA